MALPRGRPADVMVESPLTHGDADTVVQLHGERISPETRRGIAQHPDPAIHDARAAFVRDMAVRQVGLGIGITAGGGSLRPTSHGTCRRAQSRLSVAVARAWNDRPTVVQAALLAAPEPEVRSAATEDQRQVRAAAMARPRLWQSLRTTFGILRP
ncbi:hypothetical protein ACFXDH_35690 [Streptomyces sp. NPDC059467]|uniref:hypothetical protein n=1 Tax=Streptomyces sp. NPDC059467 TaxID=3346844 RepID=UPI0036A9BD25